MEEVEHCKKDKWKTKKVPVGSPTLKRDEKS
jgi:hypothetical protein